MQSVAPNPRAPAKGAGVALVAGIVGIVAVTGAGAAVVAWNRSTGTTGADAASAASPADASATLGATAPATDAAPPASTSHRGFAPPSSVSHRDASAPAPSAPHDAGAPAANDASAPAPQHVRQLIGSSPDYANEDVTRIVAAQRSSLEQCLAHDRVPPSEGALGFNLTVRQDGTVVSVRGKTDSAVGACMADHLRGTVFPHLKPGRGLGLVNVFVTVAE